eukprot:gnl/TRDRNA2_/TRDRNA2_179942_c0_seq1.p1 gnl/TRDRNA2_/TRDRNA2_179942_c0~~gnl/TRDRNA2_/TRDRNA2_179942_c0_seq1.p1  ORF type:complete len:597 (-),score=112.27 gnl/TRDRNA2_/TRDRNA2_179942_c0_seq1:162-1898(-)
MASDGACNWPREAHKAGNAGVMLVGASSRHHGVPCVLLGGRFYTNKQAYRYTDFGGGVDRKGRETPMQGALREFAEELLGHDEDEAKVVATKLSAATASALVGGRPFVHKNYVMFVISAETVVDALQLRKADESPSAIDVLFTAAVRNSELTSVALVSIEELLRGAAFDGVIHPLEVRQLDGEVRASEEIGLRSLLVGSGGSIGTISDALEAYAQHASESQQRRRLQQMEANQKCDVQAAPLLGAPAKKMSRQRRWGCSESMPVPVATPAAASTGRPLRPYIFDMETGDPDDVLTLLFLCAHPGVELRAVTITPGSDEQVALVRWLLQQMDLAHVRIGAQDWPANAKKHVNLNAAFYKSFGRSPRGLPVCERADMVLRECCGESVTMVTGAPLHNLGAVVGGDGFRLGRWVAQGGFAGEGVVAPDNQMDKFKGMQTCPTWNFGGNIPAAQAALASTAILQKICVSKNVCHSVVYDDEWHNALGVAAEAEEANAPKGRRALAFRMMYNTMDQYLSKKPGGKKLHDPLALAVALDESVCELAEVELFCNKGAWGSRLSPGSNIWISVAYDAAKFQAALLN